MCDFVVHIWILKLKQTYWLFSTIKYKVIRSFQPRALCVVLNYYTMKSIPWIPWMMAKPKDPCRQNTSTFKTVTILMEGGIFILSIKLSGRLLDMCYEYTTPPPSSLVNSDNPDKLTWVWSSTLQTVNRWRHDKYSCFSNPSFLCSFHEHPFHGQTSGLAVRPDAARWKVVVLLLVSEWRVSVWVNIALLRFLHIRAILRQKEAGSRNYVQLLSNNLNGSLYCKVQRSVLHTIFLWTVGSTVYMHSLDDKHPNRPVFDILH